MQGNGNMDIKIVVATHKEYWMPEDTMYLPVQVGHAGKADIGYQTDDIGENISAKNANYCELTGLYWAWKNLRAEYLGLAHYRRYLASGHKKGDKKQRILTKEECERLLKHTDILLPKPRNYFIETNYSQYIHAHHKEDLDKTREILAEKHPIYVAAFDDSMRRTVGHRFNMFVMKRSLADEYCEWLFDVLFELEKRLDIGQYSDYDARVFGFVSERLLDVWLGTNGVPYKEVPCIFLEKQNWLMKGTGLLKRKIKGRKL